MSQQFDEEGKLFEIEEESKPEVTPKTPRVKRNSWKSRFPVKSPTRTSSEEEMASAAGPSSGKGGEKVGAPGPSGEKKKTGGQTLLGMPGFNPEKEGSLIFKGKNSEGGEVSFDVFYTVFTNSGLKNHQFESLLNYLHNYSHLDFAAFIEGISYQGFDRLFYINAALKKVSVSAFCRFAILGAVRGSNFQKIKESCTDMPADLDSLVSSGVVIKKAKKRDDLTILRFTASIPHWVAFWLFSVNMPKKIETCECPGWLQFPGAASLPMGKKQRLEHIQFCRDFSGLLPGGTFNGNIYKTAFLNPIPVKDIPSMLKDQLGIGPDSTSGSITQEEVTSAVTMTVARVK
jgi:hypothetical protein